MIKEPLISIVYVTAVWSHNRSIESQWAVTFARHEIKGVSTDFQVFLILMKIGSLTNLNTLISKIKSVFPQNIGL